MMPLRGSGALAIAGAALAALLYGCGSSDEGSGGGDGDGGESGSGGQGGEGGVAAGGGSPGGAPGGSASGAGGGLVGLDQVCEDASGTLLPGGPCFKGCSHDGSQPPFYDAEGDCAVLSYRCMPIDYCAPPTRCTSDAGCQSQGGPGWVCVTTVGPFVGLCLLSCTVDADCPPSGRSTPYACKPIDGVGVCRY